MGSRFVGPRRLVPAPLRSHLTRTGDPKIKYGQAAAELAAKRLHKAAYRCDVCKFWHLGGRSS